MVGRPVRQPAERLTELVRRVREDLLRAKPQAPADLGHLGVGVAPQVEREDGTAAWPWPSGHDAAGA